MMMHLPGHGHLHSQACNQFVSSHLDGDDSLQMHSQHQGVTAWLISAWRCFNLQQCMLILDSASSTYVWRYNNHAHAPVFTLTDFAVNRYVGCSYKQLWRMHSPFSAEGCGAPQSKLQHSGVSTSKLQV